MQIVYITHLCLQLCHNPALVQIQSHLLPSFQVYLHPLRRRREPKEAPSPPHPTVRFPSAALTASNQRPSRRPGRWMQPKVIRPRRTQRIPPETINVFDHSPTGLNSPGRQALEAVRCNEGLDKSRGHPWLQRVVTNSAAHHFLLDVPGKVIGGCTIPLNALIIGRDALSDLGELGDLCDMCDFCAFCAFCDLTVRPLMMLDGFFGSWLAGKASLRWRTRT